MKTFHWKVSKLIGGGIAYGPAITETAKKANLVTDAVKQLGSATKELSLATADIGANLTSTALAIGGVGYLLNQTT